MQLGCLCSGLAGEGPNIHALTVHLAGQLLQEWVQTKAGINRLQCRTAAGLMFFVGNHVTPTRQSHRHGVGVIGKRMAEV